MTHASRPHENRFNRVCESTASYIIDIKSDFDLIDNGRTTCLTDRRNDFLAICCTDRDSEGFGSLAFCRRRSRPCNPAATGDEHSPPPGLSRDSERDSKSAVR
jgi:hypothetical protein